MLSLPLLCVVPRNQEYYFSPTNDVKCLVVVCSLRKVVCIKKKHAVRITFLELRGNAAGSPPKSRTTVIKRRPVGRRTRRQPPRLVHHARQFGTRRRRPHRHLLLLRPPPDAPSVAPGHEQHRRRDDAQQPERDARYRHDNVRHARAVGHGAADRVAYLRRLVPRGVVQMRKCRPGRLEKRRRG